MPAGVLRSQSGRTSLVTARRSCQRSATHGLFARISWQIQEGVNLGHADSLWAFSNFIFVHWAGFRVAKFQEAQSRGSGEDREFHGSKRDLADRKTSRGTYNFRYSAMKPETATTCKPLKRLAGPTGFEPATSCVTGRRSNQTELRPRMQNQRYCEKPLFMGLLQVSHIPHWLLRKYTMAALTGKIATTLPPKPT